jgi:hypothetical protein
MWVGITPATVVWVVSSIVMSAWTLSLGVGLMRARDAPSRAVRQNGHTFGG